MKPGSDTVPEPTAFFDAWTKLIQERAEGEASVEPGAPAELEVQQDRPPGGASTAPGGLFGFQHEGGRLGTAC